jgi:hypothetical protein
MVIVRWSNATGAGGGGSVGDGVLIRFAMAWASTVRTAATCSSSSRSAVAARTQARAVLYLFFMSAAMTMASSFFLNLAASVAWRSSSVEWHTKGWHGSPEMQQKERGLHVQGFERSESKKITRL